MSYAETYSDHLLRGGRGPLAWQRLARFRYASRVIRQRRSVDEARLLIDIGAADGIGLPFLRPLAHSFVGINYYQAHSRQFAAAHPGEVCITADARDLPLASGTVDIAVSFETLHLIPGRSNRLRALQEVVRLLRSGGLFVCSVPVETGLASVEKYVARMCTRNQLAGMTFGRMLMHCLHPLIDVTHLDQGRQVGFDASRFARDVGDLLRVLSTRSVPVPGLFPTNLVVVAERP